METLILILGVLILAALIALIIATRRNGELLEHIRNNIYNEINRRKEQEEQAKEAEIEQLRFEADRRAEDDY